MFRLIRALRAAGHVSTLCLVDRHEWDLTQHRARIAQGWPDVDVEVRDFRDGIEDSHAVFATGWESAWTILRSEALGLRCYLVQDYEPWFHAAGSQSLLAEATYGFGFKGITAGAWLPEILRDRHGMEAYGFDFGCDTDRYFVKDVTKARQAVCYYCRPSTPRRAHELAVAALRLFARRHPEAPIHFYGEKVASIDFEVTQHGMLTPAQLNDLYNECAAGLTLSASNVSLVPHEMLASGCIPVVNDARHNRLVLNNEQVLYTPATPFHLAAGLEQATFLSADEQAASIEAATDSVAQRSWEAVGAQVVSLVTQLVSEAGS
jgi:glycosyltransferase involved in cell wall biosynthesis